MTASRPRKTAYPETESFELFSADLVLVVCDDSVVAGLETSLIPVANDDVLAFVVQNRQNENGNGQNPAQSHPGDVDDVAQPEHLRFENKIVEMRGNVKIEGRS